MATTPEVLQKRFGIPAEMSTVPMPRSLYAFKGERPGEKKTFLGTVIPAIMSGAIAHEGQHAYTVLGYQKGVTQATIAKHAGVHRETVSRRFGRLSAPAKVRTARSRWLQARHTRDTHLAVWELHKLACTDCAGGCLCREGKKLEVRANRKVEDLEYYKPAPPSTGVQVLTRRRRFGMASRYGVAFIPRGEMIGVFAVTEPIDRSGCNDAMAAQMEASQPEAIECKRFYDPAKAEAACDRLNLDAITRGSETRYQTGTIECDPRRFVYPSSAELQHTSMAAWFEANYRKAGFKKQSRWIFDSRLLDPDTGRPLGTTERLVMALYESKGLLEDVTDYTGKIVQRAGFLEAKQEAIAKTLGISVRGLYDANGKWERLGVLRIVAGNPKQTPAGMRRGKMQVLYLPMLMLTEEEAAIERVRFESALRRVAAGRYAGEAFRGPSNGPGRVLQLLEAKRIHEELLTDWTGKEHRLGTFWRDCRRQMAAAGVWDDLIDALIPPQRRCAAMPAGWFDSQP
jgi:hypothetical protein